MRDLFLRKVVDEDLPVFFEYQRDSQANWMAAFSAKDPNNRDEFAARWKRILADRVITVRTVVVDGQVAGSVLCWLDDEFGKPEVSYWIGKEHWGKGIATQALAQFLEIVKHQFTGAA